MSTEAREPDVPAAATELEVGAAEAPVLAGTGAFAPGAAALAGDPRIALQPRAVPALSAAAGNAGVARLLAPREGVFRAPPTTSEKMEEAASTGTSRLAAAPPARVSEMSTINDVHQAQVQQRKVREARANLFQAKAVYDTEKSEGTTYKEKGEADKSVQMVVGFIAKDDEVENTLQAIVNLSQGAAADVKVPGSAADIDATVGAEMRHSMFSSMFQTLQRDFARLEGVVSAFLAANPKVKSESGNEAGKDLGRKVATAGKDNRAMADVHKDITGKESRDPELAKLTEQLREKMDAYTGAKHSEGVERSITKCGIEANAVRTTAQDISLKVARADTPEEKEAKAKVTEINADLAAARGALDKIEAVAKLAAAAAGVPLPSIDLPEAGAMQPKVTVKSGVGPSVSVDQGGYDTAAKGAEIAKTVTDVDIGKGIKDGLARIMTDYENRMNVAKGKLESATHVKDKIAGTIDTEKMAGAKDRLKAAFDDLHAYVMKIEEQKAAIRDVVTKISEQQKAKGGAGAGPDVAAIAKALGEVTIFIEQGRMTREQGRKEKVLTDEMIKKRESLAGKYQATGSPGEGGTDMEGNQRIAKTEKDKYEKGATVYYDAAKRGDNYEFMMHTVQFELWSDRVKKTPDAASSEVDKLLKQIDEYMATAEGFQVPLQAAMFGQ